MKYREEEREEIFLLREEKKNLQQSIRQLTNLNQNLETNIQRVKKSSSPCLSLFYLSISISATRRSCQSI